MNKYGYLYDWKTANKVCSTGWHLPTDNEWKQLEHYLGLSQVEAEKEGFRGDNIGVMIKNSHGWCK